MEVDCEVLLVGESLREYVIHWKIQFVENIKVSKKLI